MIKRRIYTKEFKIEAVGLTERSEKTVKDISDELAILYQLHCKWRRKYLKEGMDMNALQTGEEWRFCCFQFSD